MKQLLISAGIILLCELAVFNRINAQDAYNWIGPTFKFQFKQDYKKDTLPSLYCVISLSDLFKFKKIYISYNDKTLQYVTQSLIKNKSDDASIDGNFAYFKIKEILIEPFVIIVGEDSQGKSYTFSECNAIGQIINPGENLEKWNKSFTRIDSMDYVRQYDGVYTGMDGKPRYKDKNGKVYIIDKNHTRPE